MCCHLMNGITSLENDVMDKTQILSIAQDRVVCFARAFPMSSIFSYDYEIMQLPNTGGKLCVLPNVTT